MRLIISDPDSAKTSTRGWSRKPAIQTSPNQRFGPIEPFQAASDNKATRKIDVGIGVPSKYFTLPVPPESSSAVTL